MAKKVKITNPSVIDLIGAKEIEKYFNEKINEFIGYIKSEVQTVEIIVKGNVDNAAFRKIILEAIVAGDRSIGYEEDYFWTDYDLIEEKLKEKKFIKQMVDDDDDNFS